MSTQPRFASAAEARKAGWFSRRHQNSEAHIAAKERRRLRLQARKEREARSQKP